MDQLVLHLQEHLVELTASIVLAAFPEQGVKLPLLLRNMVAAMTGIKVDNIERNRLSPDHRRMVNECYSIIENWDLEIHYEKPTVDVASMKYARFIKNRKERFNIFIYDNFNGAVDVEKNGSNTTERS